MRVSNVGVGGALLRAAYLRHHVFASGGSSFMNIFVLRSQRAVARTNAGARAANAICRANNSM